MSFLRNIFSSPKPKPIQADEKVSNTQTTIAGSELWFLDTKVQPQCVKDLTGHSDSVQSLLLLPDGRIASGSRDNTIKLWNIKTGACERTFSGHTSWVNSFLLLPDGRIASGSADRTIKLWNSKTGACERTLSGHTGWVNSLLLLPDGHIASGSDDNTIKIWNLQTGKCEKKLFKGHHGPVNSLLLLPDGRIASSSSDNTIKLWNSKTGACELTLQGHSNFVNSLLLLPDGRIASGSCDNTIKLWNSKTGACELTLSGHNGWVNSLLLLPDGHIASGSSDTTIKLWNSKTGACERTLSGHTGWVNSLLLLPDGHITSTYDTTIKFWDIGLRDRLEVEAAKTKAEADAAKAKAEAKLKLSMTIEKANNHDKVAQYELGLHYLEEKNEETALSWFVRSSTQGHTQASSEVTKILQTFPELSSHFIQNANNNPYNQNVLHELGLRYYTSKDYTNAFVCFQKAVTLLNHEPDGTEPDYRMFHEVPPDHSACKNAYYLALCYENAYGTERDYFKAAENYQKALTGKYSYLEAQPALKKLYNNHLFPLLKKDKLHKHLNLQYYLLDTSDLMALAELLKENTTLTQLDLRNTGIHLFDHFQHEAHNAEKLSEAIRRRPTPLEITYADGKTLVHDFSLTIDKANKNNPDAQYELGLHYLEENNIETALNWFVKSAEQGYTPAVYQRKEIFKVFPKLKLPFLIQSANNNDSNAQHELGLYYLETKDSTNAFLWFQKAAALEHIESSYYLANCYEKGLGVKQDYIKATEYYQIAATKKHAEAKIALNLYHNYLIPVLKNDTSILVLSLQYTSIENKDLLTLSELLLANTTLLQLDLRNTRITPVYAEKLAEALKTRPTKLEILHSEGSALVFAAVSPNNIHSPISPIKNQPIPTLSNNISTEVDEKKNTASTQQNWKISYEIAYSDLTFGKKLGKGGFGEVCQGTWKKFNTVAIKKLLNENPSEKAVEEFKKEAQIMARLRCCDFTVQIRGYCLSPHYCLVMEYMPKDSLYHLLHSKENFSWETGYKIIRDMACGLVFLHSENILHRDLKSLNVLLDENYKAKLCDFGLSKLKTHSTNSSDIKGTAAWMPLEVIEGNGWSKSSDIYSLGMTFWEVASRKIPFEYAGGNQILITSHIKQGKCEDIPDDCPPKLAKLIKWCWEKDTKRPTAEQVINYLTSDATEPDNDSAAKQSGPIYRM